MGIYGKSTAEEGTARAKVLMQEGPQRTVGKQQTSVAGAERRRRARGDEARVMGKETK